MALTGSKTGDNLKAAFALESQANLRYLSYAQQAESEGHGDLAALFRATAEGEAGHAHGHLELLEAFGDLQADASEPATRRNLQAAITGETHECSVLYPAMAETARAEGFAEIADWFETLAKAEKSHATRFQRALDTF